MPDRKIDADAFNAFEKRGWQHSADPYDRYFGPLTTEAGVALLEALGPSPSGKALLDVATGPGYIALRAKRLGYATVVGVDFSEAMVSLARQAAQACASAVRFEAGDAEALAEADASFDTVTMNFGLLHLGQPQQAIAEAYRVLRPGGRFGFTVWAPPPRSTGFAIILGAIEAFADKTVPLPEGPPFFHFSDAQRSTAAMQAAGFAHIEVKTIDLSWALDSGDALFDAFLHGTARTGGLLRAQTREVLDAIRQRVVDEAEKYRAEHGIRLPMAVVLVSGTRIS